MEENNLILETKNVVKVYPRGNVKALRGVNLSIKKGDFVVIRGPSGCGKTTLLNVVATLDEVTEGVVMINGKNITGLSDKNISLIRAEHIGFVFQDYQLLGILTAKDNVMLPMGSIKGRGSLSHKEMEKKAVELLTMVGLGDRVDHRPHQLSGGQQQRVAIARALANDPSVFIADEPTGNLDSDSGNRLMDVIIRENKERGQTIVLVTHNEKIVEKLSNAGARVISMIDGEIVGEA